MRDDDLRYISACSQPTLNAYKRQLLTYRVTKTALVCSVSSKEPCVEIICQVPPPFRPAIRTRIAAMPGLGAPSDAQLIVRRDEVNLRARRPPFRSKLTIESVSCARPAPTK
jgi:hypothetical protein